ncbi:urease accessory protein UreE [Phormidium tenue]|uniref:Urease accessory protein UreE n=1 Tax=Phormidium tenue NIES-30 TaxID=549789 RepID=A0A1U7J5N8_9CYAN|nr:urease accessory protein UreE [Phormidium tenue]MBD2232445.1 urease accessory protein UreE [Phormidium tenue FACHB-1052]OKH48068.1 urease accessory protein UreE [Phormidium tenue NIES-30]
MLTVNRILPPDGVAPVVATLSLTAGDRAKSRHRFTADDGTAVYLNLPRGTVLLGGDLLGGDDETVIRIVAKPEPVVVVTAQSSFDLMRAAYHLGNRHVSLELAPDRLTLEPDPVLEAMLHQLGNLELAAATLPFEPESGAYRPAAHSQYGHSHDHN